MITNLKAFLKFLGRNRVYTAVTVVGFSVSMMFVIVLGLYVRQELSVDRFHTKGDRIYLAITEREDLGRVATFGNPVGPWLVDNYPDVEGFVRTMSYECQISTAGSDDAVDTRGLVADSTFFTTFSFPLVEGNSGQVLSGPNSAVVSQSFATRLFGAADPIGRTMKLSGGETSREAELTVTGVMADWPGNTLFPKCDFVAEYHVLNTLWGRNVIDNHNNSSWTMFVVERPGGDMRSHRASMVEGLKTESWIFKDGHSKNIDFVPLKDVYFGGIKDYMLEMRGNDKTRVTLYLGIALLILVVALLNYVNMTVAQAGFRGKEVALKKLHGATRGMIVAQLLVESLVVTLISFGAGLMLAFAAEDFFNNVFDTTLNLAGAFTAPVVAAMVGLIAVLTLVSGIVPATMMSRFKPIEIIKGAFSRRVKAVWSKVLAVFQYAVSIALLACCAVIIMQSRYLSTRDIGLTRDGVMLINNFVSNREAQKALVALLAEIPGVEAVSRMETNPFNSMGGNWSFNYNGEPQSFEQLYVDSVFRRLFGVTVTPTGADPKAKNVVYMNRVGYNSLKADQTNNVVTLNEYSTLTVAGIVSDFNFRPLNQTQEPMMLIESNNNGGRYIAVKIAAGNDLVATAERVRAAYTEFTRSDRFEWQWADDTVRDFYQTERRTSRIMAAFTGLVILIMLMGIFAMSIYTLRQKEREIALRKVHGSTIGEILVLLSRQSLVSVAIAFAVAAPVAWWAMNRWLQTFPYRISTPWGVFIVAGVAVLALSLVCTGWQSLRAATANPVNSLKSE
jgi:putative ABC transport system permease protein